MTVMDSLTRGFQSVRRYWWVLLIPILLDTFLWAGPRASVDHIAQRAFEAIRSDVGDMANTSEEAADFFDAMDVLVAEIIPQYNAFSALRVAGLGVPSLLTWGGARLGSPSMYEALWITFLLVIDMPDLAVSIPGPAFLSSPVWEQPNAGVWLVLSFILGAVGMLIGGVYLMTIARSLDGESAFWPRALRFSLRFALFWLLRLAVVLAVGFPLIMVTALLAALSPGIASLFAVFTLGLLTWVSFYTVFVVAALALNNVSVWRAIWNSFNVVLRNFWSTLGLFLLINLIGGGLTILWQQLSSGSWLTLVAIVGNAYVGTSLIAASMFFYQDRYASWQAFIADLIRRTKHLA